MQSRYRKSGVGILPIHFSTRSDTESSHAAICSQGGFSRGITDLGDGSARGLTNAQDDVIEHLLWVLMEVVQLVAVFLEAITVTVTMIAVAIFLMMLMKEMVVVVLIVLMKMVIVVAVLIVLRYMSVDVVKIKELLIVRKIMKKNRFWRWEAQITQPTQIRS